MSPTIFSPGASAVKSRSTRSGIDPAVPSFSVRLARHGRGWHGTRPLVTHDGTDQLEPGWDAPTAQLGMYPTVAVGLVGIGEDLHDQRRQLRPPSGGRRHFTAFPGEKS